MAFDVTIKEYLKEIDDSPLLSWDEEKALSLAVMKTTTLLHASN